MTGELDRALGRLPEYQRLAGALARVRAQQKAPSAEVAPTPAEPWRNVVSEAVEAVMAGGQVARDLVSRFIAAKAPVARPAAALRHELLVVVAQQLEGRMAGLVKPHADELLGFLAEELEALLAEVRDQHVAVEEQSQRYGGLRWAQQQVTEAALGQGPVTQLIGHVGRLANMPDLHPLLLQQLHPRKRSAATWPPPPPLPTAWRWDASSLDVWPAADREAFLTWLAKDPAPEPWLPSTAELVEAGRVLSERIRAAHRAAGINTDIFTEARR